MQKFYSFGLIRCMAILVLLWAGGGAAAQSADQALKSLPQTTKESGENKVVTKSNTTTTNAMNKLDSASNKAFKGFTGLFKKKNKPRKPDSTVVHPPDTTQTPKASSFIRPPVSAGAGGQSYYQEMAFFINRNELKNYLI